MTTKLTPYSTEYIEKCFVTWYGAGRPKEVAPILDKFPEDEHGRRPTITSLSNWRLKYGWDIRADDLDSKAMTIVENDLITQKANMLREQASIGFELQQLGMQYLRSHQFDTASSAVQAVIRGAELERASRGIGELMVKMVSMTNEELESTIIRELTRATEAGQIIEGEELEEGEDSDSGGNTGDN